MRRATAITHVPFEDLGSLEIELTRAGFAIDVVDACTADLGEISRSTPDLLVVLGGPIGVYEHDAYPFLGIELDLLRQRLVKKQPTIGICLGAQLIAEAAGAPVYRGERGKELGWGPLQAGPEAGLYPEFAALLGVRVLHWHGDTFDLPGNAHHLATSALYPNQAFAIGNHALGLQFHPEVTKRGLERWYVGHACELGGAGLSVKGLRQESEMFAPALEHAAACFWQKWLSRL